MPDLYRIILIVVLIFVFNNCREEQAADKPASVSASHALTPIFSSPVLSESDIKSFIALQSSIIKNPGDISLRKKFIRHVYFPDQMALVTFGAARVFTDEGKAISMPLLKRAALIDARRWAAYGHSWIKNNYQPDFGILSNLHSGNIKELVSFQKGDSLIVGYANEIK